MFCLSDCNVVEVHYVVSSDGLFEGSAFLELGSYEDCLKAVAKNNACIGKNAIEGQSSSLDYCNASLACLLQTSLPLPLPINFCIDYPVETMPHDHDALQSTSACGSYFRKP